MKIENKDFWEKEAIIATQEKLKKAADFELFMLEQAAKRYQSVGEIKTIKIFGCGTGRETEAISVSQGVRFLAASLIVLTAIFCNESI